jgi:toxin ParE1/3/4
VTAVRWTHSARRDYRNIIEWLGDRSPAAAARVADAVDDRLALLAMMPQMGRVGRSEGTRELVISRTPYIVVYQFDETDDQIAVLRLLHAAQRWPPESP